MSDDASQRSPKRAEPEKGKKWDCGKKPEGGRKDRVRPGVGLDGRTTSEVGHVTACRLLEKEKF